MKLYVCTACHLGRDGFAETLRPAFEGLVQVEEIDCMSGCARGQTVAFRSPGKTAYLFGDITAADIAELQNFARLYAASTDGNFPDARVLGSLRLKALARIPG